MKIFCTSDIHEAFGVEKLNKTIVINCACMKGKVRGIIFETESNSYKEVLLK
ncbi:hypothetical protein N4T77_00145 [Clostridium sp. CX1]|uniref:hypothetical protein n=1 Tax=Clostridium sp. CX1 TaxID=2978346 RepID=UPI0021BF0A0F|nr:hypothetical protein [Clostridium sp. CX1]MCT8974998.1 hypothetical protein [Clostridium sp. CX1]